MIFNLKSCRYINIGKCLTRKRPVLLLNGKYISNQSFFKPTNGQYSIESPYNMTKLWNIHGFSSMCTKANDLVSNKVDGNLNSMDESMLMSSFKEDIKSLFMEIQTELGTTHPHLSELATYYFDGKGKSARPLICLMMSQAVNEYQGISQVLKSQKEIAKITEMIHTSSLLHDDVIDGSNTRRGKKALHLKVTNKQSVLTGDFVLSVAATMLANINNVRVIELFSEVLVNLVEGEFMQMVTEESKNNRFSHYMEKSYNKTASLIAKSCESVAVLANAEKEIVEAAYQYGRNTGIAFQLTDDLLDYTSSSNALGKPNLNDLKSGLATAPVLFACEKFPEINELIDRQFQGPDDINIVLDLIAKSDGIQQTKNLAHQHCQNAIENIKILKASPSQRMLIQISNDLISRKK